jgi:dissimilatory sulfite reductase (desulfoviridin) alpha/beta subunit
VFEKLFALPMLQSVMLDYVVSWKTLLQCDHVCNSLAIAWKGLKHGVGKDIYIYGSECYKGGHCAYIFKH